MLRQMMLALTIIVLGFVPAVARAADHPVTSGYSTDRSVTDEMKDTATTATNKAKETVNKATEKTQETAKRAGKELGDSWITLKTKLALLADVKVSSTDVHVTTKGGVIALRGKVATDEAKQAAEADAMKIEGAKKVVNHLVVVPRAEQKVVEREDDQIVKDVEHRLRTDPTLKKASINVRSDNGIITLTGDVPSLEMSLRASEKARQVAGVRAVHNELAVEKQKRAPRLTDLFTIE